MKKAMILFLSLLVIAAGCARMNPVREQETVVDIPDPDTTEISLEENQSTGYEWHYSFEPEGIVEVIDDNYVIVGDPDADGNGGKHTWTLKGLKEGTATMTFLLYRDGENEEETIDTTVYLLTVDSDGKISDTAKED